MGRGNVCVHTFAREDVSSLSSPKMADEMDVEELLEAPFKKGTEKVSVKRGPPSEGEPVYRLAVYSVRGGCYSVCVCA